MVYILNWKMGIIPKQVSKPMVLDCMNDFCRKNIAQNIYDSNAISKRIEQAAKVKQQLDTDIFERDKRIFQSAEAKSKLF